MKERCDVHRRLAGEPLASVGRGRDRAREAPPIGLVDAIVEDRGDVVGRECGHGMSVQGGSDADLMGH